MSCYFNEGKESVSKYARCGVEKKTAKLLKISEASLNNHNKSVYFRSIISALSKEVYFCF